MEIHNVAVLFLQLVDAARRISWLIGGFLGEWQREDVVLAGLQVWFHADECGLDGAPDRARADEIDTVEEGKGRGNLLALVFAFRGEVRVRDVLIFVKIVVAFGVTNEVDCARGHGGVVKAREMGDSGILSPLLIGSSVGLVWWE